MPRTRNILCALAMCLALLLSPVSAFTEAAPTDTYDAQNPQNLENADLTARAAIAVDEATGEVLYEKNADRVTYPASTTKIMTCLVALENYDPGAMVTIPKESVNIPLDSSRTPVTPGETMSMLDLLYGMMMKSGNDAAVAVAMAVAGSQTEFVNMMNERAQELGCVSTHFVNPHGYHDEAHVTTARDMAVIARTAMQNKTFRQIVAARTYTMAATEKRDRLRLETSNSMYVASSKFYYPDLIGVKTGFHSKAGYCFVGAADKDGAEIITVALKTDKAGRWTDTKRLMDYSATRYETYAFERLFERVPIYAAVSNASPDDENAGLIQIGIAPGSELGRYSVKCLPGGVNDVARTLSDRLNVVYTKELTAPVYRGDILGTMTLETESGALSATVIATRDVAAVAAPFTVESLLPGNFGGIALMIGGAAVIVLIAAIALARAGAARRKRRRRAEMLRRRRAAYDRYRARDRRVE